MEKKKYSYPGYSKEYYKKNRDLFKARRAALSEESKQILDIKKKEYQKKYREEHKEYYKEKLALWRAEHPTYFKEWDKKNDTYQKERHLERYVKHKRPEHEQIGLHPLYPKLQRIKNRARKKGIPCTINVYDIDIPDTCPYLGIPLTGKSSREDNTPSIDRIIPELGYIPDNIEVISTLANRMKNSATPGQLVTFAKHVLEVFGPQTTAIL